MSDSLLETFREIRNRPSGLLLDTAKVNILKKRKRISDDFIARRSGRTVRIVNMTINNRATGGKTQRAIAEALGVPLQDILLFPDDRQEGRAA